MGHGKSNHSEPTQSRFGCANRIQMVSLARKAGVPRVGEEPLRSESG